MHNIRDGAKTFHAKFKKFKEQANSLRKFGKKHEKLRNDVAACSP
jgi:hypothetical protein